jgi:methylated-DNA-[protein]-cysteine S-methyltransferase
MQIALLGTATSTDPPSSRTPRWTTGEIPDGETWTYGDFATDPDTSAVAVGGACARSPATVVVPCRRVVASDGGLRGYSANGSVDAKRRLLEFEASTVE